MKLQQLRYIREIQRNGYNISLTSEKLFTSQPGISKQVALLEDELGVQIFERQGKHLSGATEIGSQIIREAGKMLEIEERIKALSASVTSPDMGRVNVYTTNAIAKFLLPETVQFFMKKYPKVSLHMGTIEPETRGIRCRPARTISLLWRRMWMSRWILRFCLLTSGHWR